MSRALRSTRAPIGPDRLRSLARQHASQRRRAVTPSHKSKMEDLAVEVCGENGAYYKVRSVKSIQKVGQNSVASGGRVSGARDSCKMTESTLVLCGSAALKSWRGNAASFDAMSHLTGRDFPLRPETFVLTLLLERQEPSALIFCVQIKYPSPMSRSPELRCRLCRSAS